MRCSSEKDLTLEPIPFAEEGNASACPVVNYSNHCRTGGRVLCEINAMGEINGMDNIVRTLRVMENTERLVRGSFCLLRETGMSLKKSAACCQVSGAQLDR